MNWLLGGRMAGYSMEGFKKDLIAGAIVGIIAIPLGMAFAIAVGVKPEYGIYTTVVAGTLISLFGGSKYQIGGPTGAFIPILFAIVQQYGYEKMLVAGALAGLMMLVMGLCKLGSLIKFIPRPVTIGFTSGIAVIIFTGQVANFLGLRDVVRHEGFLDNWREILSHLSTYNIYSIIIGLLCLLAIMATPKVFPKIPGALVGLVISTVVAAVFFSGQISTIGSAYGGIPGNLPRLHIPQLTFNELTQLLRPAAIIAILGSIESLLSCVVADGMTGERHDSNRELVGQGLANMITPLFGGIPATGAIARTATNIRTGAVSPVSGVVHSLTVLVTLLVLAPYASLIPLASMAPILMIVAWNMSSRKEFSYLLKTTKSDAAVLIATFLLTVLTNLTTAVEVGMLLAVGLFVKRMSDILRIDRVLPNQDDVTHRLSPQSVVAGRDCRQIAIFTVEGPLFFGAAQMFEQRVMDTISYQPRVLILRLGKVPMMDATGEANLRSIITNFQATGGQVLITGVQPQPLKLLQKTGLFEEVGADCFFAHTGEAISYATQRVDHQFCKSCRYSPFSECKPKHAMVMKPQTV